MPKGRRSHQVHCLFSDEEMALFEQIKAFMPNAKRTDMLVDALRVLLSVLQCEEVRVTAARRQLTFDEAVADFLARKEVEHVARAS